jgi:hypothetical protein
MKSTTLTQIESLQEWANETALCCTVFTDPNISCRLLVFQLRAKQQILRQQNAQEIDFKLQLARKEGGKNSHCQSRQHIFIRPYRAKKAHTGVKRAHKRNKHTSTEQLTSSLSDLQKNASLDSRGRARIEQFPLDKST